MPDPELLSCPLCLRAEAAENMLAIPINHGNVVKEFITRICPECCAAILEAIERGAKAASEAAAADQPEIPDSGEHPSVADSPSEASDE